MEHKSKYTNKLIHEKSPYLRQHSHNPINWYPWGKEAFDIALAEDKPIFLSIGYSTCHWCHVMENECFENEELAKIMNKIFVSIKVDREELPEVDNLYMEFAQSMMTGSSGWPLNLILTPTLHPFFASTYLPLESSEETIGMFDLVEKIEEMWKSSERDVVIAQSDRIVEVFREHHVNIGLELPDKIEIENTAEHIFKMADPIYGGIAGAPKFPISYLYDFLLCYSKFMQESRAMYIVEKSLDMMHRGGIYDHLAGGFSRYSVDEKWIVPHFEKMLYDNALLSLTYLRAWQATKNEFYSDVSKEILNYVLQEMTHQDGGFFSAEDADSEGIEGQYYTWTKEEIIKLLGKEDGEILCEYYNVLNKGLFHGRNILHTLVRLNEFMAQKQIDPLVFLPMLEKGKAILLRERKKRVHPFKDDKIICNWNGQMIHSLVEAGLTFARQDYLKAAIKAAQFIRKHMWINGILFRRWRDQEALHQGVLDDYAYMIKASISLFEATGELFWLDWALYMTKTVEAKFKEEEGAFYLSDGSDPNIILRKSSFADGAEPSGNAIHCENLLRLFQITLDDNYKRQAKDILKAVKNHLEHYPLSYIYHTLNLLRYYDRDAPTLVFALNEHHQFKAELQHLVSVNYIPHKSIIWRDPGDKALIKRLPYLEHYYPRENKTTLYVCRLGVCQKPVTEISEITEVLSNL